MIQSMREDDAFYVYIDDRFIQVFCEFNSSKFGNLPDKGEGYSWIVGMWFYDLYIFIFACT